MTSWAMRIATMVWIHSNPSFYENSPKSQKKFFKALFGLFSEKKPRKLASCAESFAIHCEWTVPTLKSLESFSWGRFWCCTALKSQGYHFSLPVFLLWVMLAFRLCICGIVRQRKTFLNGGFWTLDIGMERESCPTQQCIPNGSRTSERRYHLAFLVKASNSYRDHHHVGWGTSAQWRLPILYHVDHLDVFMNWRTTR